jgi:hypothetical protein
VAHRPMGQKQFLRRTAEAAALAATSKMRKAFSEGNRSGICRG